MKGFWSTWSQGRMGQNWKLVEPWASLSTHSPTRHGPGAYRGALPLLGIL